MGFADPESKDSNLESTNPGFRDSSLTSPMTSLVLTGIMLASVRQKWIVAQVARQYFKVLPSNTFKGSKMPLSIPLFPAKLVLVAWLKSREAILL